MNCDLKPLIENAVPIKLFFADFHFKMMNTFWISYTWTSHTCITKFFAKSLHRVRLHYCLRFTDGETETQASCPKLLQNDTEQIRLVHSKWQNLKHSYPIGGMEFAVHSHLSRIFFQMDLPGETCMKLTSEDRVQLSGIMNVIMKNTKMPPGHFYFNDSEMRSGIIC